MIAANKNLLKANLTQGVLGIQTNLINLYSSNLTAIATQAALLAGFAFQVIGQVGITVGTTPIEIALSYIYQFSFTISFITSIIILSQSTLVVTLGPSMALKGNTNSAVKIAAIHMFKQLLLIYKIAFISITCLFIGSCVVTWSNYTTGVAAVVSFCFIYGYYYLIHEGIKVFHVYADALLDIFDDESNNNQTKTLTSFLGKTAGYKQVTNTSYEENIAKTNECIEATKLKARGIIWRRQAVEEGGLHVKCYAVLERGLLDFFKSSKDFKDGANPLNKKPLKLWELDLITDPRKYSKKVTSVRNAFTSAVIGNEDFGIADLLSSEYDLKYAAKHFKFALVPKVASELAAVFTVEFIAHDETSYTQWTETFRTVINAYDSLASNPSVEQTMRTGVSDVETVVMAANNTA